MPVSASITPRYSGQRFARRNAVVRRIAVGHTWNVCPLRRVAARSTPAFFIAATVARLQRSGQTRRCRGGRAPPVMRSKYGRALAARQNLVALRRPVRRDDRVRERRCSARVRDGSSGRSCRATKELTGRSHGRVDESGLRDEHVVDHAPAHGPSEQPDAVVVDGHVLRPSQRLHRVDHVDRCSRDAGCAPPTAPARSRRGCGSRRASRRSRRAPASPAHGACPCPLT